MKKFFSACAALSVLAACGSANAVTLYSNNFDGAVVTDAGVGVTFTGYSSQTATTGAWNAAGWAGSYADNRAGGNPAPGIVLTLTNLAAHTTVSANFIAGFLESWDARLPNGFSPDNFDILIDGVVVVSMTTNNALGNEGEEDFDGGTELFEDVQVNSAYGYYDDTLVNMGTSSFMTFAHSASTLTVEWRASGAGWQGGTDEGIGIDNLSLTYNGVRPEGGVPEPSAWALMILGFGAAGATLRRRKTAVSAA